MQNRPVVIGVGCINQKDVFDNLGEALILMEKAMQLAISDSTNDDIKKYKVRMILSLDIRLLKWLLYGPDKAHWSDADLGSHLRYERVGSVYKRGLFYCWNNFCAVT